jgi:thiamine pyrophosphokinase
VLIVGASPEPLPAAFLTELASTHRLVIAADGGAAHCLTAGVPVDLLVGDFDSVDGTVLETLAAQGTRIVKFPVGKDFTDLELALAEARAQGATRVTVTGASGGRLDHTLGALGALASVAELEPALIEPGDTTWVLAPEGRRSIELQGDGATVSLIAFGGAADVTITGVRWPLNHARLTPDAALGVSNVITGARARISVHEGVILAISADLDGTPRATLVADS